VTKDSKEDIWKESIKHSTFHKIYHAFSGFPIGLAVLQQHLHIPFHY